MSHELDENNIRLFSRSPYTFRKISSIRNFITGHKKASQNCFKTDLKHILLKLGHTNDCKEELAFLLCVETQKHRQKQLFSTLNTLKKFLGGHEHSTRDSRRQRLISINAVVTEHSHREPP